MIVTNPSLLPPANNSPDTANMYWGGNRNARQPILCDILAVEAGRMADMSRSEALLAAELFAKVYGLTVSRQTRTAAG